MFSNKMLVTRAGLKADGLGTWYVGPRLTSTHLIHNILSRIANCEDPDLKKQFDLGLHCLSIKSLNFLCRQLVFENSRASTMGCSTSGAISFLDIVLQCNKKQCGSWSTCYIII